MYIATSDFIFTSYICTIVSITDTVVSMAAAVADVVVVRLQYHYTLCLKNARQLWQAVVSTRMD